MTSLIDVYHALPVWTQNLAISMYGAQLRWKRYGGEHARILREIQLSERLSEDELWHKQSQLLFETMHHAAALVPFYRGRHGDLPATASDAMSALRSWPIISKADVQKAGKSLIASDAAQGGLIEVNTGGTTGRPLSIWADRAALQRNYAFFERFKRWTGVEQGARVATFAGRTLVSPAAQTPPYWRHNRAANQLLFSSYHISPGTVEDYIRGLEKFDPDLIDSYPSSIEPIARAVLARGGTTVRPRAVVTSSETLYPEVRAIISDAFGCPVFDHYGSAEMVALISQCEKGTYHVNSDFGFLEILDPDDEEVGSDAVGEIVATGFINSAMPLIRYRIGDLAARDNRTCSCNRHFPAISELRGRADDVIVTPDGRRVGRIDPIFKSVSSLHEARVVQTDLGTVRLEIVAAEAFADSDLQELVRQLLLRLGPNMRVEVERVASIPRTASGKLQTVVSLIGRT